MDHDLIIAKTRHKNHNYFYGQIVANNLTFKNMNKQRKFKLCIYRDKADLLYAEVKALNNRIIWKTTDGYSTRFNLVNACRYIPKPAVIQIDLPSDPWKYINKLELMLNEIWE